MKTLTGIVLAWLACGLALACGTTDVCNDVSSSLGGSILIEDGIAISWNTDAEDSTIEKYELHRFDCGNPAQCLTHVATITARGACTTSEEYEYNDNPPDPDEDWTYRIRVFKYGSSAIQCQYDVVPEE